MEVAWFQMNVFAIMVGRVPIVPAAYLYLDVSMEDAELILTLANVATSGQDIFVMNLSASKPTLTNRYPSIWCSLNILFKSCLCQWRMCGRRWHPLLQM